FSIGYSAESRDEGARLIRKGLKTATSELLWSYQADRADPPVSGSVSILLDGRGEPVCVVESVEVTVAAFDEVDEQFAREYGEWGGTLESWRERAWEYYCAICFDLGREPCHDMPLVCERFEVLHMFNDDV
ncbi:MAG: ASCH domain-containing protein, partial [Ornithinimicrobium sp.]